MRATVLLALTVSVDDDLSLNDLSDLVAVALESDPIQPIAFTKNDKDIIVDKSEVKGILIQ